MKRWSRWSPTGAWLELGVIVCLQLGLTDFVKAGTTPALPRPALHQAHAVLSIPSQAGTMSTLVLADGSMSLVVSGTPPESFRIAGGGPSGAASACFIPSYRGLGLGAVAIGDPLAGPSGRVHIFFLDGAMDSIPDMTLEGVAPGDCFGASVAGVGDLDSDEFGDLVVGAPGRGGGAGSVFLFRGGTIPQAVAAAQYDGSTVGERFGASVAGGADFDLDAHPDFAIGSPGFGGGAGLVSIVRGAMGMPTVVAQSLTPPLASTYSSRPRFGASLAVGDVTGDGRADLIVGSPGAESERGRVSVYRGSPTGLLPHLSMLGAGPFDQSGTAIAVEDLTRNGVGDVIVGSPGRAVGTGSVSVYFGGPGMDVAADFVASGEGRDDQFGWALAKGLHDPQASVWQFLVGAPLADIGSVSGGQLYVIDLPENLAVDAASVLVEADGAPLRPDQYLDPSTKILVSIAGGVLILLSGSAATVDGIECQLTEADGAGAIGVVLPAGLSDGSHRLRMTLATSSGQLTLDHEIKLAHRFELLSARLLPSPSRGDIHARFVMTRRGRAEIQVFDASGRVVGTRIEQEGNAGDNRIELPGLRQLSSGVYFYRISASYAGQEATTRGRLVITR